MKTEEIIRGSLNQKIAINNAGNLVHEDKIKIQGQIRVLTWVLDMKVPEVQE